MVPKKNKNEWISRISSCSTDVWFDTIDSDDIKAYIETGEPMDKAGSYGIQGYGGAFIKVLNLNIFGFINFCF